jgi:hypothetical protein
MQQHGSGQVGAPKPPPDVSLACRRCHHSGRATHYGGAGDPWSIHHGSCGFKYLEPTSNKGWDVAALTDSVGDYKGSCGRCYEVRWAHARTCPTHQQHSASNATPLPLCCRFNTDWLRAHAPEGERAARWRDACQDQHPICLQRVAQHTRPLASTRTQDGYGTGLDRSHVCYDTTQTLTVMITDTCELPRGVAGLVRIRMRVLTCADLQPVPCRPLPLPSQRIQQQAVVLQRHVRALCCAASPHLSVR